MTDILKSLNKSVLLYIFGSRVYRYGLLWACVLMDSVIFVVNELIIVKDIVIFESLHSWFCLIIFITLTSSDECFFTL